MKKTSAGSPFQIHIIQIHLNSRPISPEGKLTMRKTNSAVPHQLPSGYKLSLCKMNDFVHILHRHAVVKDYGIYGLDVVKCEQMSRCNYHDNLRSYQ